MIKDTKQKCSVRCNEYDTVGQNMTKPEVVEPLGTNFTINFHESLTFQDENHLDHIAVEPDPCQKAGPLCDYYRYQNKDHVPASSSFVKLRNDIAGAIGE